MPQKFENHSSNLLSEEENQEIHGLLQPKCKTVGTAVVELYCTRAPTHTEWAKRDVGILCFERDNFRKSYFFRIYCLRRKGLIWEEEIYKDMEYSTEPNFFHSFEGDKCIYGFNFACLKEAQHMKQIVLNKLETRNVIIEKQLRAKQNKEGYYNEITPKQVPNQKALTGPEKRKGKKSQKEPKRRLTKADIGRPTGFKHIKHISIDSKDNIYQPILEKIGIDNTVLENRKTREFVYEFLDNYPNIHKVTEEIQRTDASPAVPKRSAPKPPQRTAPSAPSNRKNQSTKSPHENNKNDFSSPPPKMAPPPPPLPPRPPSMIISNDGNLSGGPPPPPPPPPPAQFSNPLPTETNANTDMRSALLSSIREGRTLKAVSNESSTNGSGRDNMLQQIKEGIALKPASERELKSPTTPPPLTEEVNNIAFALKKVLASRSNALRSDDSTSDTSDEDDWDP